MELQLTRLNPWWEQKYRIDAISRPDYLTRMKKADRLITFLVGLRRIGKTTIMKLFIQQLQEDINPKHILYVPIDHPVFIDKTISEIVEKFREINGISFDEKIYLFFDEIQSKEDFARELKSLYDNENVVIFCSGSQSLLMHDRKAALTGRTKTIEVAPLTFEEYLQFREIKIKKSDTHLYKKYFEEYLEFGGIPKYVLDRDPVYVVDLVDSIITKDIVSYHNLKNAQIIRELFLLLCERAGKRLSINKIARILSTNVESIRQYISYLTDTYLIYLVYRKTKTLNERIKSNKKVYISDVGIRNVVVGFKDKGSIFENLVFLNIKDKTPFYYYEDDKEIDFVFGKQGIECKYKETISEEETKYLQKVPFDVDIVKDYRFFL